MRFGKYLYWCLLTVIIVFLLLKIALNNPVDRTVQSKFNGELTIKEAIMKGLSSAKKWNKKASIVSVTSVDEKMGGTRGINGRRLNWTLTFMVPGTNDHLLVGLSDGIITETRPITGPDNIKVINLQEIVFDSPVIVDAAKKKYHLLAGEDWATGYHFAFSIVDSKPIITVLGLVAKHSFTRISFNSQSGLVTQALHKIPEGGGLIQIRQGKKTPHYLLKGAAVKAVTSGNTALVMFGDRDPREFNSLINSFLLLSRNNGETWTSIEFNGVMMRAWFNEKDELYIATPNEIWSDVAGNKKISLSLETKIEDMDSSGNNIAVLSNGNIYFANDGIKWLNIPTHKELRSVEVSSRGQIFGFSKENEIFQYIDSGWSIVSKPRGVGKFSNAAEIGNKLYLSTGSTIWIFDLELKTWDEAPLDEEVATFSQTGNQLFAVSNAGAVYKIIKGSGTISGWKTAKMFELPSGVIRDIAVMEEKLYIATCPDYFWVKL